MFIMLPLSLINCLLTVSISFSFRMRMILIYYCLLNDETNMPLGVDMGVNWSKTAQTHSRTMPVLFSLNGVYI